MRRLMPAAFLTLLFAGCGSDSNRIVGIWVHNDPSSPIARQFTFQSDGQFAYISRLKVKPTVKSVSLEEDLVGTYTVTAGLLNLNFTTPGVKPVQYKVSAMTDTTLLLETASGPLTIWSYTRVGKAK